MYKVNHVNMFGTLVGTFKAVSLSFSLTRYRLALACVSQTGKGLFVNKAWVC